jgi:hypothetical protein
MQTFQRNIEDFKCENCENLVYGDGYTNHCPECLWSKHVDIYPGDRDAVCQGLMCPIQILPGKVFSILHKCTQCGEERKNRISKNDNIESFLTKEKF